MSTPDRKPRGRVREPARETNDLKRRIIEAARDLFLHKGYQAVSMRKIASRIGYTTGAIYRHFPNKQSVLQFVWEEDLRLLNAYVKGAVDQAREPHEKIRALFVSYILYWEAHPDNFRVAFGADGPSRNSRDGGPMSIYSESVQTYESLKQMLATALTGSPVAPQDPDLALQSLISAAHGIVALKLSPSHLPSYRTVDIAQVILDGLMRGWGLVDALPAEAAPGEVPAPTPP